MTRYIFSLLPQRTGITPEIQQLAALIALYNQEQPANEFINWLQNNLAFDDVFTYQCFEGDFTVHYKASYNEKHPDTHNRTVGFITPVNS